MISADGLTVPAYAKLNLALRIIGRRPDGFHELETLFERIDLHDELTFTAAPEGIISIVCRHPAVPCDERNLVYKAALLLRQQTGTNKGVRIFLRKRIPVAAGLAGGSSNGAAALLGLNRFWGLGLSITDLTALADRMGSDLAFFLQDVPFALGTGRGEKVRPIRSAVKLWHVLVTPTAPLLTKDVYGAYAASIKTCQFVSKADTGALVRMLESGDSRQVRDNLFNDLQFPILYIKPALAGLKDRMDKVAGGGGCFSGSGPTVFAVMQDRAEAEGVAQIFRRTYRQVSVAATC